MEPAGIPVLVEKVLAQPQVELEKPDYSFIFAREFLHADDLAEACYFLMQNYNKAQFLNIGTGEDISIKELALLIKDIVGFEGILKFDPTKPDGTPRKLMDVSRLHALGWHHTIDLKEGITKVYAEASHKFETTKI
jgi:GDP-L-fucose synthase